jgi:hypothetical protein
VNGQLHDPVDFIVGESAPVLIGYKAGLIPKPVWKQSCSPTLHRLSYAGCIFRRYPVKIPKRISTILT